MLQTTGVVKLIVETAKKCRKARRARKMSMTPKSPLVAEKPLYMSPSKRRAALTASREIERQQQQQQELTIEDFCLMEWELQVQYLGHLRLLATDICTNANRQSDLKESIKADEWEQLQAFAEEGERTATSRVEMKEGRRRMQFSMGDQGFI